MWARSSKQGLIEQEYRTLFVRDREVSKMQALKTLPPGYEHHGTLDLSKNKVVVIGVNIIAAGVFFLFGWMAVLFSSMVRIDTALAMLTTFVRLEAAGVLVVVVVLLVLQVIMVVLHEFVHGIFFWYLTRERPVFGLKFPYAAYAAAPDWYLPRNWHLVVGLAPFVLITLGGLAVLALVPALAVPPLLFVLVSNAAGAVGDFVMVAWLLRQPGESLVRDTGSAIMIYRPTL